MKNSRCVLWARKCGICFISVCYVLFIHTPI